MKIALTDDDDNNEDGEVEARITPRSKKTWFSNKGQKNVVHVTYDKRRVVVAL